MPLSKNKRTQIPKFSRTQLETANRCARALWYGVDYETGNSRLSDAEIMNKFSTKFISFHKTRTKPKPDIFVVDVKQLIKASKLSNLFRWIKSMDFRKGIDCLYKDVHKKFLKAQKRPNRTSTYLDAIACVEKLNHGLVKDPRINQYNLASRILFFTTPNLQTFNLNGSIAIHFGLQVRAKVHYKEYFELFAQGMITNQTKLSKYSMPPARAGLDSVTWNNAKRTDWWRRKVLDLAVLLHVKQNIKVDPNLLVYIRRQIKLDQLEKI